MDEKISLKALEDYSDDYSSKVTASFFSSKEKITGSEILKLCDIHQINLFVIRELLYTWKLESNKLRSPFFDYSSPDVSQALSKFLNLLSNNISISKENFQPLLKKAVQQTLYLIFDPYDFYSETLDRGNGGNVKTDDFRNDIKYVKINRVPLEKLLTALEGKGLTSFSGNEAFAMLDHILEEVNFTPEDIEGYIVQFSKTVPLNIEKFYDTPGSITISTIPEPLKVEPVKLEPPKVEVKIQTSQISPAVTVDKAPEVKAPLTEPVKSQESRPVTAQTTLYDQFQKPVQTSLADDFQKKKKIKDSLTINQKFMFTKILFNGDFELFSSAIERLDELDNLSQAKNYLNNNYGEWNSESEEYQEFMEMVKRRFA